MKIWRFVTNPILATVEYEPYETFSGRLGLRLDIYRAIGVNVPKGLTVYVSACFPGPLPDNDDFVIFKRQTLLKENQVLIGIEEEVELGGQNGGIVSERAIG